VGLNPDPPDSIVPEKLYSSAKDPSVRATPVKPEPSSRPDEEHQVLPFRPRKPASKASQEVHRAQPPDPTAPPVEGLAKYQAEDDGDDYRHRMMVNLAALLVTLVLAIAGGWLAIQIADLRKNQDCVLSGRTNCMRIDSKLPR
jgi:hypothetical protein